MIDSGIMNETMNRLGLQSVAIEAQSDEQLIERLVKKLKQVREFVYLYCAGLSPQSNLDLTSSLKAKIDVGLQSNDIIQKHLQEFPLYDRKRRYSLDQPLLLDKAGVNVFCSRLLHGINVELQFALEKRLLLWLSSIPIGGKEKRHYDVAPILEFAIAKGLEADSPETITRNL